MLKGKVSEKTSVLGLYQGWIVARRQNRPFDGKGKAGLTSYDSTTQGIEKGHEWFPSDRRSFSLLLRTVT